MIKFWLAALFSLLVGAAHAQGVAPVNVGVPDGADITQGAKADAVCGTATGTCTLVQIMKYIAAAVTQPVGPAITPIISAANASGAVVKASAGTLYGYCVHTAATAGWVMVFNSTTVPADGAVTNGTASGNLSDVLEVAANTSACKSYTPGPGNAFSVGISIAFSSTAPTTKTASATVIIEARAQ